MERSIHFVVMLILYCDMQTTAVWNLLIEIAAPTVIRRIHTYIRNVLLTCQRRIGTRRETGAKQRFRRTAAGGQSVEVTLRARVRPESQKRCRNNNGIGKSTLYLIHIISARATRSSLLSPTHYSHRRPSVVCGSHTESNISLFVIRDACNFCEHSLNGANNGWHSERIGTDRVTPRLTRVLPLAHAQRANCHIKCIRFPPDRLDDRVSNLDNPISYTHLFAVVAAAEICRFV